MRASVNPPGLKRPTLSYKKAKRHRQRTLVHGYTWFQRLCLLAILVTLGLGVVLGTFNTGSTLPLVAMGAVFLGSLWKHCNYLWVSHHATEQKKHRYAKKPEDPVTVTVLGPFTKAVKLSQKVFLSVMLDLTMFSGLDLSPRSHVGEVLWQLRRRRLIADTNSTEFHVLFPTYQVASLNLWDNLEDLGIGNLSILHVRVSVLGGSSHFRKLLNVFHFRISLIRHLDGYTSHNESPFLSSWPSSSKSAFKIKRITNSKLMEFLPWSVPGFENEEWREWVEHPPADLKIPHGIRFNVRMHP